MGREIDLREEKRDRQADKEKQTETDRYT